MEISEYWKPDPGPELARMSDEECAEGFLEAFTRAIAARLRAPPGTVCSMLSGGIDSGSVTALAGEILASRGAPPLPTYSAVRRNVADCAETRAIQAAMTMPAIAPNLVDLETVSDTVWPLITGYEEPYDAEMMMIQCIYRAAQGDGYRVVLDGMGGDVVLAEGSYIVRLIRSGQVGTAFREVMAESRFWGDEARVKALFRYGRAALAPEAVRKMLTAIRRDHHVKGVVSSSLISASFAERINIARRLKLLQQTLRREWTADYAVERSRMIRPSVTAGRERYARASAAHGIEARDPFLDKRVVDYCLRLPGHLLLRDGWPKFILRKLMTDKLPGEVLWQRGKPHLGWRFNRAFTKIAVDRGNIHLEQLQMDLADYVEPAALNNAWQEIMKGSNGAQLHSAHVLWVWLRENAGRPRIRD
jgi:asparagine synthase (glutamine-hydrolysing)